MNCSNACITKPRLLKNLYQLQNTSPAKYSVWPISSQNIYSCIGSITGPENTPYEAGIFYVSIVVPTHKHGNIAKVKFLTKIFHPNVSAGGDIASHKLRSCGNDIVEIIETLHNLLCYPDLKNSQNVQAKNYYKNDINEYNKVATEWTKLYAS